MFLALLVDGDGSVYARHDGSQPRSDRLLAQPGRTLDWQTARGEPVAPGRFDLFAPPPEGLLLTSFSSTGRVFTGRAGALSLKGVVRGRETYELDRGLREVSEDGLLVVNEGREYTSVIEPGEAVETFCVSFGRTLAAEVARDLRPRHTMRFERQEGEPRDPVEVLEAVYRGAADLKDAAEGLRQTMASLDGAALQERGLELLARLLGDQSRRRLEVEGLDGLRRADRLEVLRRLLRVRDSIEATLGEADGLDYWAALADMSRFHFVRSFKAAFGMSPHRYRMARRLERARELLQRTRRPATEIALELGFDGPSHFAAAYRRSFSETPGQTRRATTTGQSGAD